MGRLTLTSAAALLGLLGLACGADAGGDGQPSAGGSSGAPGGSSASGAAPLAGMGGSSGSIGCEGATPAPAPQPGRLELPIKLTIGSSPAVIGASATAPSGREYQLSMLKLFLTQPVLVDAAGNEAPGQLVGPDAQPLPYGVQLIDLADPNSQVWRIAAAEGTYRKLRFGVGVPQGCNSPSNSNLVYPLNPDSEMFWSWGAQFMFVRVEGTTRSGPSEELGAFFYHVGFDAAFAHVTVEGALSVSGVSQGPTLVLDVARMLATDAGNLPAPQHNVPDGWVADNLERDGTFELQ